MADIISLAVWDVPMPVVAAETFAIKLGAKAASSRSLAGCHVAVIDASGKIVTSATLGETPLAETDALYSASVEVPAPLQPGQAEYAARFADDDTSTLRFSVVAAAKPEHTMAFTVTERDTGEALAGVEIRLGPFHGRTDAAGRAELRVCKGHYQLQLWRNAHIAPASPIEITCDQSIALTMVHVPEEHPDARWVR